MISECLRQADCATQEKGQEYVITFDLLYVVKMGYLQLNVQCLLVMPDMFCIFGSFWGSSLLALNYHTQVLHTC